MTGKNETATKVPRFCEFEEDEDIANINTPRKDQFTQNKGRTEKKDVCNGKDNQIPGNFKKLKQKRVAIILIATIMDI